MKEIHYVNLTNGIEAIPELRKKGIEPRFIRIQSTICEQHHWDRFLYDLDHDFLMHLALGDICHVYDFGANKPVPKSIYQGLEFLRFILNRRWFHEDYIPHIQRDNHTDVNCRWEFLRYEKGLSRSVKRKIDYFIPYLDTEEIRLVAHPGYTMHDGDKDFYKRILQEKPDSYNPYWRG